MTYEEKIDLGVKKFLNGEGTLTQIRAILKLSDVRELSKRLEELGYKMYRGAKLSSIIGLKKATEEYIDNINNNPSLTKICAKYHIDIGTLSKRLKELNIEVINYQNRLKFDNTVFDCIDTEEKAYWLGFIFADGYIDSSPLEENKKAHYTFELSLKGSDAEHLHKFNKFMKHENDNVKMGYVNCEGKRCERCRWWITDKHLWKTLNKYGCTPRKSLTLQFPNENIFKSKDLIRHFIRGYWDGDGCISYSNKEHTKICINVLGTEQFLVKLINYIPYNMSYTLQYKNPESNNITSSFIKDGLKAYNIIKYLYDNCTIYLDRKYEKFIYFRQLYEKSYRPIQTNIGEGCDANTEITTETKESVASQSVELEPNKQSS